MAFTLGVQSLVPAFALAAPKRPAGEPARGKNTCTFVMDAKGREIENLSRCPDKVMLIASTTKIMTALLIFDAVKAGIISLDDEFPVSFNAANQQLRDRKGALMGLREGQSVKVKDLLWGLTVISGNDAAVALAEGLIATIYGPVQFPETVFVQRMNAKARELGLKHAHFENPNGLLDVNKSTAREIAMLMKYMAEKHGKLSRTFLGRKEYPYGGREFHNHFGAIGRGGIEFAKSGFTTDAGYCGGFEAVPRATPVYGGILGAPRGPKAAPGLIRDQEAVWLAKNARAQVAKAP
jgi:D-alanyl-D-alanine carboxypeptidase